MSDLGSVRSGSRRKDDKNDESMTTHWSEVVAAAAAAAKGGPAVPGVPVPEAPRSGSSISAAKTAPADASAAPASGTSSGEGQQQQLATAAAVGGADTGAAATIGGGGRLAGKNNNGKSNAFAQLVRGWEAYMNDPDPDAFPQVLQLCGGPGVGVGAFAPPAALLPPSDHGAVGTAAAEVLGGTGHPLAPPALRHTHSSPLKYGASLFGAGFGGFGGSSGVGEEYGKGIGMGGGGGGETAPLPPIPLDPFQRSSSTPSSFRHRNTGSAFDRISSQRIATRSSYTSAVGPPVSSRISAFDPVKYYARALEDMERTSIEVTAASVADVAATTASFAEAKKGRRDDNEGDSSEIGKVGAASRAARFLSDVRVLRRRRRAARGGRDNPARPSPSVSSTSAGSNEDDPLKTPSPAASAAAEQESSVVVTGMFDTSVTVITGDDDPAAGEDGASNANETSMLSRSSEVSAILNMTSSNSSIAAAAAAEEEKSEQLYGTLLADDVDDNNSEDEVEKQRHHHSSAEDEQQYQPLESDIEEELHIRTSSSSSSYNCHHQQQAESPGSVPSPSYQQIVDDRPPSRDNLTDALSAVSQPIVMTRGKLRITIPREQVKSHPAASAAVDSPSPTRMMTREGSGNSSATPRSSGGDSSSASAVTTSPGGASGAGGSSSSSSGHTTQATFSTSSSALSAGLSTISETDRCDREVMEANKEGKRRRQRGKGSGNGCGGGSGGGLDDKLKGLRRSSSSNNRNSSTGISGKRESEAGSVNSNSTNSSSNPNGYLALDGSPVLREGANVPADRFFTDAPNAAGNRGGSSAGRISPYIRSQQGPLSSRGRSGQSGSPGTLETSSATQTSSSGGSSCDEQPPTFVSYLDRQTTSDSTSTTVTARDAANAVPAARIGLGGGRGRETSADLGEEREDSPAPEILGYSELIFEEAGGSAKAFSGRGGSSSSGRNRRSRPPRSPTKGMRPLTTPPPRGSVSPQLQHQIQQSPPRNIVDRPSESSLSRPYVMRTAPARGRGNGGGYGGSLLAPIPDSDHEGDPSTTAAMADVTAATNAPLDGPDAIVSLGCVGVGGGFAGSSNLRGCRYTDGSIEISSPTDLPSPSPPPALVTPEKDAAT